MLLAGLIPTNVGITLIYYIGFLLPLLNLKIAIFDSAEKEEHEPSTLHEPCRLWRASRPSGRGSPG
ncbi:MAG: hypothetical protein QME51_05525, partial [Planctomycetota bacterium]|nr:hypothetical protein [Planctomycetota bacterium]